MQTILELLTADGIQAIHVGKNEWHSPCPWCQGTDRFSSWPDRKNSNGSYKGGRAVCRGCGWFGDGVAYLMKRRGLSFGDACRELHVEPGPMGDRVQHKTKTEWIPGPAKSLPVRSWSDKAKAFLSTCQNHLQQNPDVMSWLKSERGLNDETVHSFSLGWNPVDRYDSRNDWGLPDELKSDGKKKKVWMPAGLVIPWRDESGQVDRLRIRRTVADSYGRYIVVSGSSMTPMVQWGNQPVVAVVESELDGFLLSQECTDIAGFIAMGSAQARPDTLLHKRLMEAETVLCCLDSDAAGAKESWGFWKRYPGFHRWPAVKGKDVCEQWRAGIPVRDWIAAGL